MPSHTVHLTNLAMQWKLYKLYNRTNIGTNNFLFFIFFYFFLEKKSEKKVQLVAGLITTNCVDNNRAFHLIINLSLLLGYTVITVKFLWFGSSFSSSRLH